MQTPYDWITVAIFAGLIVVFLQRSTGDGEPQDSIWSYLPPSIGCAVANQVGNHAVEEGDQLFHLLAVLGIVAVLVYIHMVIKPFQRANDSAVKQRLGRAQTADDAVNHS